MQATPLSGEIGRQRVESARRAAMLIPGRQSASGQVQIRVATASDRAAVERLAELDSTTAAAGETLVAEVDGEIRAALSLFHGRVVADPFRPTAHLAALLQLRARQLDGRRTRGTRGLLSHVLPLAPRRRHA